MFHHPSVPAAMLDARLYFPRLYPFPVLLHKHSIICIFECALTPPPESPYLSISHFGILLLIVFGGGRARSTNIGIYGLNGLVGELC